MKAKAKKLSPHNANTYDKVCSLQRDNKDAGDYWIMTDGSTVTVCAQRNGEPSTSDVHVPRALFNRLVDWYIAEQQTVKR